MSGLGGLSADFSKALEYIDGKNKGNAARTEAERIGKTKSRNIETAKG